MFVVAAMVVSMHNRILFGESRLHVGVYLSIYSFSFVHLSFTSHGLSPPTSRHFIPGEKITDPQYKRSIPASNNGKTFFEVRTFQSILLEFYNLLFELYLRFLFYTI